MTEPSLSRRGLVAGGVGLAMSTLAACRTGRTRGDATANVATTTEPLSFAPTSTPGTASPATAQPATTTEPTTTEPAAAARDVVPPAHRSGEWESVAATDAGFTEEGIAALVEMVGAANSESFILLRDGRIVAEQYWNGVDAETVRDIASCQKSIVSTLVGLARQEGVLTLEDTVTSHLGMGWSAAAAEEEAVITLRHLLTMTSGLDPDTLRVVAVPGARWAYNTPVYQKLRPVLETATESSIEELTDRWLFSRLGVSSQASWSMRPGGLPDAVGAAPWGLRLTVRDMARFGLFAMRDGVWDGQRIAPTGWFAEAWTPIPQKADYGYLWWLVGRGDLADAGAPVDTVAALGAQDQKIYVVPSAGLVLCRQGPAADTGSETKHGFDAALVSAVVAAITPPS